MTALRAVAYGGGVQSTALLVLAANRTIDFNTFLFCDVGTDSENPDTIDYVRDHAIPYAERNGIDLLTLQRERGDGTGTETLLGQLEREDSRSLTIPVRMANGAPGNRRCTADFKIKPISRWAREHGATPDNPTTVGIGISLDEIHRATGRSWTKRERIVYPLLDHTPPLRRTDCMRIIANAGLPVPPKSSCWFCPFRPVGEWARMRRDNPELFSRAVELERTLNRRRETLGKDHVFLTRYGRPLDQAITAAPEELPYLDEPGAEGCDGGVCFV